MLPWYGVAKARALLIATKPAKTFVNCFVVRKIRQSFEACRGKQETVSTVENGSAPYFLA
jgi:hypothetical protein